MSVPLQSRHPQSAAGPKPASGWKVVFLASLGGTLEFYDFVVFGVFARDIAAAIFPAASPLASLMASFAAFAAGYLARPIGGLALSHVGDRYGRRAVFLWSVFIMSGATLGMGLVPTFATWGAAASATMVLLRIVQGLCLGGELPGALTYVVETTPRIAPFVCGLVFTCVTLGVAAATGVSVFVRSSLSPELVPLIGWRIAFIVGGLGGVLSFVLRRSLEESPEFSRIRTLAVRHPFVEVVKTRPLHTLTGICMLAGTACFNGLFFSHLPAYLTAVLKYDPRQAVVSQTAGVIASALAIAGVGWIAGRVPPRYLLRVGVTLLAVGAIPFYRGLESRAIDLTTALVAAGICAALTNGSFAVLLTDLFPTQIRFTGVALVFNVAFTIFSGLSPLFATTLIGALDSPAAPAYLMIAAAIIAWLGSLGLRRYGGNVLGTGSGEHAA
jgi:MFS family permease